MRSSLWRVCIVYAGIALLLGYLLVSIRPLLADDAVVGDGTPASCTEAAFDAALTTAHNGGGGTITFNCGGAATIVFTTAKVANANIMIDGADQITLSGGSITRLFTNQANLTLQHITLTEGGSSGDGGAINNSGNLTMTQASIFNSSAVKGGAIYHSGGTAVLTNVTLSGNWSEDYGGAIYNLGGTAVLTHVTLSGNSGGFGGGGILNDLGTLELADVTLSDNSAGYGGGIYNLRSTATLTNVTLSGNSASVQGGGIWNYEGTAVLTHVAVSGNSGGSGGGGIFNNLGTLELADVTLSDNSAGYGGGIYNSQSTTTLTNVTLSGNSASEGGGIFNYAGTAVLTHVTVSDNSAAEGGGIFNYLDPASHLNLKNSIIADNPTGGNCASKAADEALFSLWDDESCTFTAGSGNLPNTDPLLGPLADNGGSTLTHMLLEGSPAIDAGMADGAPTTDQRGSPRPAGPAPDMGAVEVQFMIYIPVVVRPESLKRNP